MSITSPTPGQQVDGERTPVSGTACDLGDYKGWILVYNDHTHLYYPKYAGSPGPVVLGDGPWNFPISSLGPAGRTYAIHLVLAPPSCSSELRSEMAGKDYVASIPADCDDLPPVTVRVAG